MISFLCSDVGRGHPFYLDGVVRALAATGRQDLIARRASVFAVSRGLSLLAWCSVRASYRLAGRGGPIAALYHRVRGTVDYDADSTLLRLLGRDVRRWAGREGIVVVDHPVLVGALRGRPDVWYVHGELVAPAEAVVRGAARVLVPREDTADAFAAAGFPRERLLVTGICVENELQPGLLAGREERGRRLAADVPLTLAFFSSGAEPRAHVEALATGAATLAGTGHRALVFAARGGRLERALRDQAVGGSADGPELVPFSSRDELDRVTAERFPEIDVVVSPPHERVNWALALGVPFLLVGPDLGPFAPLNRALVLREGVATEVRDTAAARDLPVLLARLRAEGRLAEMSRRGHAPGDGFSRAARRIVEAVS